MITSSIRQEFDTHEPLLMRSILEIGFLPDAERSSKGFFAFVVRARPVQLMAACRRRTQ